MHPHLLTNYLLLGAAIVAEVIGTTALVRAESFTRLWPSLITVVSYSVSFWLLSFPIRVIPAGIVYAIWSGTGIVLITLAAWLVFGQRLDLPAIFGLALIVAGVVIVNLFSGSVSH
ncbi:SMR family transporter [Oricola thermophila]|uniref:QacE family quaternary ammonium compound efflux SMR transporter n=1 Tax=Oricola thermophila TaxID=2742145 RepID=A0A6N1V9N4_9HYPH|nr:SMR family transporter [Oricola thermophila]QKV17438.1 QacE family quaternary ammonium compound efflux SMR transporter [Oricola thermophila]